MFPYFILFGKVVSMYVVMAIVGMIIAGWYFCAGVRKRGLDDNDAIVFLLMVGVGILAGSHLLYAVTKLGSFSDYLKVSTPYEFLEVTLDIFGGAVFYGGLIGGGIAGLMWVRHKRLDRETYLDLMAPTVPLFHAFARVGCFFGGCCYGIESEFGFAAHGNTWVAEVNDIQRFPVQLLEALCNFALFFVLSRLYKTGKFKGILFALYLIFYSAIRFLDEYLRGDSIRGFFYCFSTSQLISMLLIVGSVVWICQSKKQKRSLQ